jgi:hypothetical protein
LAKQPPLQIVMANYPIALPEIFGGFGVALARSFRIINPRRQEPANRKVGSCDADL